MQWIRIGIRLGSQLLTVLVVMFIIHRGFPSTAYTPISLPSNVPFEPRDHVQAFQPSYANRTWLVRPFHYQSSLAVNDWFA